MLNLRTRYQCFSPQHLQVPQDLWSIFSSREACCNKNFPYSDVCLLKTASPPTKYPTIEAPDDDNFEIIPIRFDISGLPEQISMRELKDEMKSVLKRMLLRLSEKIEGLQITQIEEVVVLQRERSLRRADARRYLRSESVYFNVYVVRDDDRKFGPIVIQYIRDNYDEVIEEIK